MSEPDAITAHTHDTAHTPEGLALLIAQLRGKPLLAGLLTAWLSQVQDLEDALWAVLTATLDAATDAALDQYGALLAFARQGLDDATYRATLQGLVLARRSKGTPEDLQAIVLAMLGTDPVSYAEDVASVTVEPTYPMPVPAAILRLVLDRAKAAGVQLAVFDPPAAPSALFTLAPSSSLLPVADSARGWGDSSSPTVGGLLTGVL